MATAEPMETDRIDSEEEEPGNQGSQDGMSKSLLL